MMAQAAGKCLNAQRRSRGLAMLVEIRTARFRRWVRPDEKITLQATTIGDTETVARAQCSASVAGTVAASCKLVFSFKPREQYRQEHCCRWRNQRYWWRNLDSLKPALECWRVLLG